MDAQHLIPSYEGWTKDTLVILGGDGSYLFTDHGKLLDLNGGAYWTTILGNGNIDVKVAMTRGFSADLFGTFHTSAIELAKILCHRTGYEKVSFGTSGSDAVDTAIRMAYQYHRSYGHAPQERANFITLKHGFHGTTFATLTTSGFSRRSEIFPTSHRTHIFNSWVVDPSIDSIEKAQKALATEEVERENMWLTIGAFLFEPVQGVAGIYPVNPYCYQVIADRCRQHRILIVADEISTGVGRTGQFLATESFDPRPDIITLGKSLSNGEFALSATLVTAEVWKRLDAVSDPLEKYLFGSCYAGHPTGCLAAIEVLRHIDDKMLKQIKTKGEHIGSLLNAFKQKHRAVTAVRGIGLMWGIEFMSFEICNNISKQLIQRGIRCGVEGKVLTIFPHCYMDIDSAIGKLTSALDDILAERNPFHQQNKGFASF